MPELTVIIPVFNRQSDAERAISSVLSQDVACDIIVVDDHSQPQFKLGEQQARPHVRLLAHDTNLGAAAARNTGISQTQTEYVTFLDSDDFLLPDALKTRFDYAKQRIEAAGSDTPTIVGCGWHDRIGKSQIAATRIPRSSQTADDFCGGCWVAPGSCIIARTDLFASRIGPADTALRRLEDVDWFLRFAMEGGSFVAHPLVGVSIRKHDHKAENEILEASDRLKEKYGHRLNRQQMRRLNAYLFLEQAAISRRKNRYISTLADVMKSIALFPRLKIGTNPGWDFVDASGPSEGGKDGDTAS